MNTWNHFLSNLFNSIPAGMKPWGDTNPMTWAAGIWHAFKLQAQDDEELDVSPWSKCNLAEMGMDHNDPESILLACEDAGVTFREVLDMNNGYFIYEAPLPLHFAVDLEPVQIYQDQLQPIYSGQRQANHRDSHICYRREERFNRNSSKRNNGQKPRRAA